MTDPRDTPVHLTDERLAAFLDGRLTPDERDQSLAHFATCAPCRHEMTAARRLLAVARSRRRGWYLPAVSLVAAAFAFAVVPRLMSRNESVQPVVRASMPPADRAQPDVSPQVQIVAPRELAVVADSVVFRWLAVDTDATYRLTVQDSAGAVVWETTVGDTSVTLPRGVRLAGGQSYFWSVDAQLADGRTAKAAVHRFATP